MPVSDLNGLPVSPLGQPPHKYRRVVVVFAVLNELRYDQGIYLMKVPANGQSDYL